MLNPCSTQKEDNATRREFFGHIGQKALVGSLVVTHGMGQQAFATNPPTTHRVGLRILGKTGLKVSEIGFGGHSWSYARIPDGKRGFRRTTFEEALRMISLGLDLGVNFFDSCTPREEHSVPGEVVHRLKRRKDIIVSARLCHRMKGVPADKDIIWRWVEERLALWRTDYFDILMLTNTEGDTPESGYWDMSYSLEALDKLKKQGKIRFAGFGCHFTPAGFRKAFARFGKDFDVCSLPYNIRHRMAEELLPEAKRLVLGVVTIKAFARGDLLTLPIAMDNNL